MAAAQKNFGFKTPTNMVLDAYSPPNLNAWLLALFEVQSQFRQYGQPASHSAVVFTVTAMSETFVTVPTTCSSPPWAMAIVVDLRQLVATDVLMRPVVGKFFALTPASSSAASPALPAW
jgi:hypothetical protein